MEQRRGISGDEIRREQEESRRRSRFGEQGSSTPLPATISIIVGEIDIDWLIPLAACSERGFGKAGLVLMVVAFVVSFCSSHSVTIGRGEEGVYAVVRRLTQRASRARHVGIDGARMRYWNAWFCRGFELAGANASVTVSSKRVRWLRPLLGVPAVVARPRFRPTARALACNLPNIVVNAGTLVLVWGGNGYLCVLGLLASYTMLSSVANWLFGGPELVVNAGEDQPAAPRDRSAQAA